MTEGTALSALPMGWVWTTVEDIIQPSSRRAEPISVKNMPFIGLEHIGRDTGRLLNHGDSAEVRSTKTRFYSGDVLYGRLRPYLNKVHLSAFDGVCSTDILVFNKQAEVDSQFLAFRLLSNDFVSYASRNVSGVQHPRVSFNVMGKFSIALPPLPEQRRIVAKIEELLTRLDTGVEALKKVKLQIKRYRQSVLKSAFEGKLTQEWREVKKGQLEPASALLERVKQERRKQGKYKELPPLVTSALSELPEGWAWGSLEQLSWDSSYGTSDKCAYGKSGSPVIRIPNIVEGRIDLTDLKFATASFTENMALKKGDIVIIRTNGSKSLIGRAALVDTDFKSPHFFASYLIRFRICKVGDLPKWVSAVIRTPRVREWIEHEAATSAGQYNISQSKLNGLAAEIPPLAEQSEIISEIERLFSIADEVEATVDQTIAQSDRLRQSILKQAFEGKLVPQDPRDEPADKLLERIRAERAGAQSGGNGKARGRTFKGSLK